MLESSEILLKARKCLELEENAIRKSRENLNQAFVDVVRVLFEYIQNGKKLVFSGVGKNAPICQKLVGTFNSTGVTAVFLDPLQALHGDLGICDSGDIAIMISNSGGTEELVRLAPLVQRIGLKVIVITAESESLLAEAADWVLPYQYEEEACPLKLAPTASTTVALSLGDALAMVLLEMRGFTRDDFAKFHPSGNLGKVLLLKVTEIMRTGNRFAKLAEDVSVRDAIYHITQARCGTIALVDAQSGALRGVFSDGDFRRASLENSSVLDEPVSKYMTPSPITIRDDLLAVDALRLFEAHKINDLVVVNVDNQPVGIVDGQDLPGIHLI